MTDHITWDTLNELADDVLAPSDRAAVELHLRTCESCTATLHLLQETARNAASLPRSIEPPAGLWDDVRASIDARKLSPLAPAGHLVRQGWWMTPRRMGAAAILLVVVSSATTAVIMRSAVTRTTATTSARTNVLPVSWQSVERGYLRSVDELRAQLDAQRDRLSPATISAVERSLAAIDVAIAEARQALVNDPANAALSELLASNYRQKVELLRRAAQLNVTS